MSNVSDTQPPTGAEPPPRARGARLPSLRLTAALAAGMLAVGVAVGAAIGPAPTASYGGAAAGVAQRLPLLLAGLAARAHSAAAPSSAPAPATNEEPTPASETPAPAKVATPASTPAPASAPAARTPSEKEAPSSATGKGHKSKLPAIADVWLIELSGTSFTEASATPAAAPYITGQLIPAGELLSGWSALSASAFAGEAALAEPPVEGAAPPLLQTIVQPPCPEGAAGAACAIGTPGQLTAADSFLQATLAQITNTPAYREHGLVVVTFATVGIATQAGLPAGASSTTLTYKPPAGVVLLSPFVHKGAHSAIAFNPTSPRQSIEALLH